jgi:hypothetical protein
MSLQEQQQQDFVPPQTATQQYPNSFGAGESSQVQTYYPTSVVEEEDEEAILERIKQESLAENL